MDWTRGHTIGHGSTATVSVATAIQSGDVFAVKSVELSQSEFLRREQKILSSIVSPFIVSYKGCDITRKHSKVMYNLFLEYMPDGSLRNAIHAHGGGRLGESLIRVFTCQILQGLDYLHLNGLVHCDIKSSNILVGERGAKIADFGCAKRVEQPGPIAGTPMFMAPEVARGEEQGLASDIWALGCTIIEMASGAAPWHNVSDPVSIIYRVGYSGHLPEFPCCLSEQARDFLDKCLRRDPKERWTASQLLAHPFLVGEFSISKFKNLIQARLLLQVFLIKPFGTPWMNRKVWRAWSRPLLQAVKVQPVRGSEGCPCFQGHLTGIVMIRIGSRRGRIAARKVIQYWMALNTKIIKSVGSEELLNLFDSNISNRIFDDF
ncbi:MAP KINASE KINASE KINASE [Salix purpurea]|uniref:MAP KINASE KINASE KINASE n=1 Tax=Salix purpurea TaxID=77065 RepID=A0A9Q0P2P6_SALPP|nr:MAP KINASE KINASE KINASE [Salix purpurea]